MGIEAGKVLRLDDMARSDNVVFSATGITKGDLLDGITRKGNMATTETLLIRGKSHYPPYSIDSLSRSQRPGYSAAHPVKHLINRAPASGKSALVAVKIR
jgi:fructose-1,6-bisphosphatase/sedoheptulose 1,7-bisphosphatase-like protein